MIPANREWLKNPPASAMALEKLQEVAGVELPAEYLDVLASSNGGEGPLPLSPWNFCLDSAEETTKNREDQAFEEFFPGFFVFGGNGGGELIAFDMRGDRPWPIVTIDGTNIDLEESVRTIAASFIAFLDLVGIQEENA